MLKKSAAIPGFTDAFLFQDLTRRGSFRHRLKAWSLSSGLLPLYHRLRNKFHLTTVAFHRVLPADSSLREHNNDDYVLSTDHFRRCVDFFTEHYSIVGLEQVVAAVQGNAPLPAYPLLITFDDGWSDTLEFAAPILVKQNLPAACFAIGDALTEANQVRWQDAFAFAWRQRCVTETMVRRVWHSFGYAPLPNTDLAGTSPYVRSGAMMQDLPPSIRFELIERWLGEMRYDHPSELITPEQCIALHQAGISIGAHGASHTALPYLRHPRADLFKAKLEIEWACHSVAHKVEALSFPHGQFTEDVLSTARDAGFRLMFNSVPALMELQGGMLLAETCGRIEIATKHITDAQGRFRPDFLGFHLFTRPTTKDASVPTDAQTFLH